MNVLFHTIAALGVSALIINPQKTAVNGDSKKIILTAVVAFIMALLSHGILDYVPHCYPINSKIDVAVASILMIILTGLTNRGNRLITGSSFAGCIFPDLVDLLPGILNKQLGFHIPATEKIFPWHLKEYSGSIYNGNCTLSTVNHLVVLVVVAAVCLHKRSLILQMFTKPGNLA